MKLEEIKRKNKVLIKYLNSIIQGYDIKAEYSTNDNDKRVIVVQEQAGNKVVFYGDCNPIYDYYMINIYGLSIQECKETSVEIGNLIGKNFSLEIENKRDGKDVIEKWQIIFMQMSNPQTIMYEDIRRVGYTSIMKCIVNLVSIKDKN